MADCRRSFTSLGTILAYLNSYAIERIVRLLDDVTDTKFRTVGVSVRMIDAALQIATIL